MWHVMFKWHLHREHATLSTRNKQKKNNPFQAHLNISLAMRILQTRALWKNRQRWIHLHPNQKYFFRSSKFESNEIENEKWNQIGWLSHNITALWSSLHFDISRVTRPSIGIDSEGEKNEHFIWTNVPFCSFWATEHRQMPWTTHMNIHECLRITLFHIGFRLENDCCANGTFNSMPNNQICVLCMNKKRARIEM